MLYFRVDMNQIIAMGHVMRCLSIADAAKRLGEDSTFILADTNAVEYIHHRGFSTHVLHSKWNDMKMELPLITSYIQQESVNAILVDHYSVTEEYLSELRKNCYVYYIDDINAFRYPVDGLICYANYYKKYNYETRYPGCELMLGTKFVPLRMEFSKLPKHEIKNHVDTVLIMSGGSDPYHAIQRILNRLENSSLTNIYAICGLFNQDYELLKARYKDASNISILKTVDNMIDYMKDADLAISAAGSTLYELAAVGTPTITYTCAENQIPNAIWFHEAGVMRYAGDIRDDQTINDIIYNFEQLAEDKGLRVNSSIVMSEMVDGKGAMRIAEKLIMRNQ